MKVWVVQNKLQLNDDKTEILLIGSAHGIDHPSSVRVGQSDISFSSAARNLGVIFDSELAQKEQVNKLCQLAYLEIKRIGSIRQYLPVEATKTLVSSLVLSRLDYCNALLAGCPQVLLEKIQRVINCSAHLIYKASKSAHIIPLLFAYQQPDSIQNSSHLLPHYLWYSSSIPLRVASPLFFFSFSSFSLGFSVSQGRARGLLGRDPFSISDLSPGTLFLSLTGMPRHSPLSSQN